ncbi:MAG: ABC transporter permease [Chloroflexi bacterium]|nr:ABC transporter permease [Chloroflexota bacterium]
MNRPRWQKIFSDLWKNKSRSLLVIASIAAGLFAAGIIAKTYLSINSDMQVGYQAINPANIQIQTSLINQDNVARVGHLEGVEYVEATRQVHLQVKGPSGGIWDSISVTSKDFDNSQINQVKVLDGDWPPRDHQIVLADHKLKDIQVSLGDWIILRDPAGDTFSLQVVGIVKDQSLGSDAVNGGFFNTPITGYVTENTLEWLQIDSPDLYNELLIIINNDPTLEANRTTVADVVRQDLENNHVMVTNLSTQSPLHHPNKELVDAITGVLILLGFLVIFLSAFLITNTLQSLLDQQIQQIGIMKTVGAKRSQITLIYMTLIFIFGILAFVIAYPLANIAANQLDQYLASTINFNYSGAHFEPVVMIIELALAMLVPQVAAFFPIQQGVGISVQEALSGVRQLDESGKGWVDRLLAQIHSLSRPLLIAIRNIFRRKGRLALTLITLTLAGAVFISVFSVRISLSKYIDQISQYFLADLNLSLTRPYRIDEIDQILSTVPEISNVEAWNSLKSSLVRPDGSIGDSVSLVAVPGGSQLIKPILLAGRWLVPEDQNAIVLNDQFQERFPSLKVGDTLELQIDDSTTDWVVVGFFQLGGKIGGLAAYVNQDYLSTLPGQVQNQTSTYRIVARNHPDSAAQKELAGKLQSLLDANNIQVSDLTTGSKINDSSAASFAVLTNLLLILAILTALVGSIGLAGTMSMNVMDRTREIGVMRSIGASDSILMKMVLVEGLGIGWISWLLGALLSFPISKLMSDLVTRALFGAPSQYGFTLTGFIVWFVIVSVLSILASYMPARSATKLTIREVLAYE